MAVTLGSDFAAAPCAAGTFQPAGWPTCPWQSVLLKQPYGGPATRFVGTGTEVRSAPITWQFAQTSAFPVFVFVCVLGLFRQGVGEWGEFTPAP